MGFAQLKIPSECENNKDKELSEDALAIIDHLGQILAEEYVALMKQVNKIEIAEEKQDESSNLCQILK